MKKLAILFALLAVGAGCFWLGNSRHVSAQQQNFPGGTGTLQQTGNWIAGDVEVMASTANMLQDGGPMFKSSGVLTNGDELCANGSGQAVDCGQAPYSPASCVTPSLGGSLITIGPGPTQSCTLPRNSKNCDAQASDGTDIAGVGVVPTCTVLSDHVTAQVRLSSLVVLGVTPTAKTYQVSGY